MTVHRVFGGLLETELAFPDLPEVDPEEAPAASGAASWTLALGEGPAEPPTGTPLGEDEVEDDVRVRLYRDGPGLRLVYDDTGHFRVSGDGRSITWTPPSGALPEDAARLDVLGRVLPLALHLAGRLTLHASAVAAGEGALVFLGPKGCGKSTLAARLCRSGAELLTDDALPVDPGPPPRAWPGVPRLRLRGDAARAAGLADGDGVTDGDGRRVVEPPVTAGDGPHPLAGLYVLAPVSPDGEGGEVRRERLRGPRGVLAMMGQIKLGPILTEWAAGELLERCVGLAESVPVHRLEVPRELDRLDDVESFLRERHGDFAAGRAASG